MAQVTLPYTLTAGTPENVNNLVSNLNALVTGVNTIDTAQIADAAITVGKLAPGVGGTPPTFVTTLPASPTDGQEVFYQSTIAGTGGGATDTMATTGAVWYLRYNASAAGSYKWQMVGGSEIGVQSTTSPTSITSASPVSLSTNPVLTLPNAGDYWLEVFSNGAGVSVAVKSGFLSIGFTGGMTETATVSGAATLGSATATTSIASISARYVKTITGASTVLTMKAWVDSGATLFPNNISTFPYGIRAIPIRIG